MNQYITLVYSDEHPDFEKLSTVTYEKGLVGAAFTNLIEVNQSLHEEIENLEHSLSKYCWTTSIFTRAARYAAF